MSETNPAAPEPRTIAGRYEVVQKLGAGAFGTVYKAKDTTLSRMVAIKTIRLEGLAASSTSLDELLKRFKQEATAGAQLKHPNIVTIYDFGQSEGLSYLAMEFVDGVGLERIIAESGRVPLARAAGLAAQVADALGYAHERGVVHRDIKPANVMVESGERVKVTDFGIARVTDSPDHLTQTGSLLGTPSYMSPEQAKGDKVDGRSDLFSVGCLFYELLAGRKAFSGDTITAVLFKITQEQPRPIRELNPLVPEAVAGLIEKALAKTPEARHQTGRDLARDLLALTQPGFVPTLRAVDAPTAPPTRVPTGDAPTIATPPTAEASVASLPTMARPGAPEADATAPVPPTELVPGPSAPKPPPQAPARGRRPRPLPARPRSSGGPARALMLGVGGLVLLAVAVGGLWFAFGRRGPAPSSGPPTTDSGPVATAASPAQPIPETTTTPLPAPAEPQESIQRPRGAAPTGPGAVPEGVAASAPSSGGTARVEAPPPTQTPRPGAAAGQPVPPPATGTTTPPQAAPPPTPAGDGFLDQLPEETPDGRASAEALAQQYRSGSGAGGSSTYGSSSRFKRRPRIPPHGAAEQPAVRALAWILSAQNAHLRRTGRYGTLGELVSSGDLPLGGQWSDDDGFVRRQYRFTVTAAGESFRADARPLSSRGRAFYTDDSGFVLVGDD